jgi:hypothetical protein
MALIQCPECKTDVSDQAPVCPKCGCPIAAPAPAATAPPSVKPKAKAKGFFDAGANVRILVRLLVILGVLGGTGYFLLRQFYGERVANRIVKTVTKSPIDIADETIQVQASSWAWQEFNTAYDGTLVVTMEVVNGNPVDVMLVPAEEVRRGKKLKDMTKMEKHIPAFHATKTKSLKRESRLPKGAYALVLHDGTLGLLSASRSDVKVKIRLEP